MDFADLVRRRHMVRNFDGNPIDAAVLDRVLDAGRRAPSAGNTQGTEFIVLVGEAQTRRYWDATLPLERREGFRWPGLLLAPVLIIPCVDADAYVARYGEHDKAGTGLGDGLVKWQVPYWHVDGGMAAMLVLLAADDEGLGALFFGIFDHEHAVRAEFNIPDSLQPIGTIALGHALPGESGRSAARPRRAADEVIHRGGWSTPHIFHLALAAEWDEAVVAGEYRLSTIGQTLEEVGFIDCSHPHQVAPVANAFYAGHDDLVLLTINPDLVTAEIRLEQVGDEWFPHLYGPLPVEAVVAVTPYPSGPDGVFPPVSGSVR